MKRRGFLIAGATATVAALGAPLLRSAQAATAGNPYGGFPVSYVAEFRATALHKGRVTRAVQGLATRLKGTPGFLGITLKQMVGTSTMVMNYPPRYKGILADANEEAVEEGRLPYSFLLLVRFADPAALQGAKLADWLHSALAPALAFTPPGTSEHTQLLPLAGIYASLIAGDRKEIFSTGPAIARFLAHQDDTPERKLVTVVNHVMVPDKDHALVEAKVGPLLKVAQNTFEPKDDANGIGQPGAKDNRDYRKAVSTEILANTETCGSLRSYLMHGVWESVWDHENSHLDPRFQHAFLQLAPDIVVGPVEPFYQTWLLENRA